MSKKTHSMLRWHSIVTIFTFIAVLSLATTAYFIIKTIAGDNVLCELTASTIVLAASALLTFCSKIEFKAAYKDRERARREHVKNSEPKAGFEL